MNVLTKVATIIDRGVYQVGSGNRQYIRSINTLNSVSSGSGSGSGGANGGGSSGGGNGTHGGGDGEMCNSNV